MNGHIVHKPHQNYSKPTILDVILAHPRQSHLIMLSEFQINRNHPDVNVNVCGVFCLPSQCISSSAATTIYNLGRPVQAESFATPLGEHAQPAAIKAHLGSMNSTITITAYSQVPIHTWVE